MIADYLRKKEVDEFSAATLRIERDELSVLESELRRNLGEALAHPSARVHEHRRRSRPAAPAMSRDYSSWNRAVRELQQLSTKKTGEEIVGEAVRGFIREVVNVTPPAKGKADGAAKKADENTIENDLTKLATPVAGVSGRKARAAMATAGDLRAAWADARKGQSSGRVNPATRKKLLVSKGDFNRVLREIQKQVGILAAGWNAAANRFGARLPAWIKRHGTRGGRDLKAQTGQSAGDLLVLRQAFQNAGLGADGVAANVSKMQKALSGANEEGNSTADALKELGLNMEQVAGSSTVDQMKALTGAFAKVSDPIQRARLATDLFGKSGAQMLRIFGDAGALSTARQQVGGLADTMNQYSAQMDAVGDALGSLGTKQQQFFGALLSGALPELTKAVDKINSIDLTHWGKPLAKPLAQSFPQLPG